ncbi:MAG: hypothetical protein IOMNBAOH_00351 [Rhodocyclaceae bacterium]|nr:tripartite tricarboxylate transporter substrate binding protein [Rhodocyclaceae bacterium]MCG3185839.1 hypothetical protein [Rhodocyclaceae bacterium]
MPYPRLARSIVISILLALSGLGHAQSYPNRPIRWVVPFSAGSTSDVVARAIAPRLADLLGQPVSVDNRPGAGGVIGTDLVAKAPADGYTLLFAGNAPLAVNVTLQSKVPYDPVKDFVGITQLVAASYLLVVHPSLGVNNVAELVAAARARPGKLNYGSPGNGTGSHLTMELFKTAAGLDISHVPYKGSAPAITDLLAGQVQLMFEPVASVGPHVRAGKLKALAMSSARRIAAMPDMPTVAESGFPGFQSEAWIGVAVRSGTPQDIIVKLHDGLTKVLQAPDLREQFSKLGLELTTSSPEAFTAFIKAEIPKWAKVIRDSGAKVD